MNNISLGDVSYNAKEGAFEARVDIRRDGSTFRYPCALPGPMTMNMATVRDGLTHAALQMSDTGGGLVSRF